MEIGAQRQVVTAAGTTARTERTVNRLIAAAIWAFLVVNAVVIVWLWVQGGNVTSVTGLGLGALGFPAGHQLRS